MTTSTSPGTTANASARRSRVPSSSSSTPATSSSSTSSWRAAKCGDSVSTQGTGPDLRSARARSLHPDRVPARRGGAALPRELGPYAHSLEDPLGVLEVARVADGRRQARRPPHRHLAVEEKDAPAGGGDGPPAAPLADTPVAGLASPAAQRHPA